MRTASQRPRTLRTPTLWGRRLWAHLRQQRHQALLNTHTHLRGFPMLEERRKLDKREHNKGISGGDLGDQRGYRSRPRGPVCQMPGGCGGNASGAALLGPVSYAWVAQQVHGGAGIPPAPRTSAPSLRAGAVRGSPPGRARGPPMGSMAPCPGGLLPASAEAATRRRGRPLLSEHPLPSPLLLP